MPALRLRPLLHLTCVAAALCLVAVPARGDDPYGQAVAPAWGDTTDVYQTAHYRVLQVPQYLWDFLVYPLGQFTIYAEHEELHLQVRDLFTNADHTFGIFPQVQLGGETRTGGGARLVHTDLFGRQKQLEALYIFSHADRQLAQALYRDPAVGGGPYYWTLMGDYLRTDNHNSTVNGILVDEAAQRAVEGDTDLARFAIESIDVAATLGWRSHAGPLEPYRKGLYAEATAGFGWRDLTDFYPLASRDYLLHGEKATPTAQVVPALGEQLSFARLGVRLAYDDRDYAEPVSALTHGLNYLFPGRLLIEDAGLYHSFRDLFYPERGGLLQAEVEYATGSDEVRYLRLGAEVQRFWTLFWRERILAVRGRFDKVHAIDDGIIPYTELPTLGGSQRLRGYERGNFRGEGAVLLALEYRYPVWDTWNAFLFYEEGQVFDEYGDIEMDHFHSSYGAGLSLRTTGAFLLGLRIAHSAQEDALVGFTLEQEF